MWRACARFSPVQVAATIVRPATPGSAHDRLAPAGDPPDRGRTGPPIGARCVLRSPLVDRGRTTVYVAEDHPVFRGAVVRAIQARQDFELAGAASEGRIELDEIRALR